MGKKNEAIQIFRLWTITLIIASHCGVLGQGGVGNCIFFAISGFFSANPYDTEYEQRFFGIRQIVVYYWRRIIRIIPITWLCLFFATWGLYCFDPNDVISEKGLLPNMFFIKSLGHLWFLQQIMLFYIFVPVIMCVIGGFKKIMSFWKKVDADLCTFVFLNIIGLLLQKYLTTEVFYLTANGNAQSFRIGLLLIGMSFAYLYKSNVIKKLSFDGFVSRIGTLYIILFCAFTILSSEQILNKISSRFEKYYIGWEHPVMIVYLASIVIIILMVF